MVTLHRCRCHDRLYTRCATCAHQYCPTYWTGCPRCGFARRLEPVTPAPALTLTQWAERWPYRVTRHPAGAMVTPDTIDAPAGVRAAAFALSDAIVSSVTAGSIWFIPRAPMADGSWRFPDV